MSNLQKTTVSDISIEDALAEISELSKNKDGLIYNKNSMEGISQVLSSDKQNIEQVATQPNNTKEITKDSPKKENKIKNSPKPTKKETFSIK